MLGFSVWMKNEAEESIGSWTDRGDVHSGLEYLVSKGYAEEVEIKGGYPDIYRIKYRYLDMLLSIGIRPMSFGFRLDTNYDLRTEADKWVTIELWDQS